MSRVVIPVVIALAVILGLSGSGPAPSVARAATPVATPGPTGAPECADAWADADVRPYLAEDASVVPANTGGTLRELYLVVITLPPGGCMPYDAPGNQKDGGVVLIVQQGEVIYTWRPAAGADPGSMPLIGRGDLHGNRIDLSTMPGEPQTLYPGDWVTQDQKIEITYRNTGGDSAVILKAVYAVLGGGGCHGGCK